jgi:SsrA-binding protein
MAVIAKNKKAYFDYFILEKYEAGIKLEGSEVKSLRLGKISLKESFIRIVNDEAFLFNSHITHIPTINTTFKPDERRSRTLLLHKREIRKLNERVKRENLTIVPLQMYFNSRNLAKLQIALVKGKKLYDKRAVLKKKDLDRNIKNALKDAFS